jgi:hypothetical protein
MFTSASRCKLVHSRRSPAWGTGGAGLRRRPTRCGVPSPSGRERTCEPDPRASMRDANSADCSTAFLLLDRCGAMGGQSRKCGVPMSADVDRTPPPASRWAGPRLAGGSASARPRWQNSKSDVLFRRWETVSHHAKKLGKQVDTLRQTTADLYRVVASCRPEGVPGDVSAAVTDLRQAVDALSVRLQADGLMPRT